MLIRPYLNTYVSLRPDVIVCVDACFQQKHGYGGQGEKIAFPNSCFLTEEEAAEMEKSVETTRAPAVANDTGTDTVEAGMLVSEAVLNVCESSFKATDDKRQKASTRFFAETGLMALLCRHDQALFVISMTSAGEKQHYVLALLKKLFDNIPKVTSVGVLYDIGCQLHCSIVKWDFLAEYSSRIHFGISVFHAFGHQWARQLIYHPRKATGFGMSDGERCERFWSLLKHLIPSLRVSGVRGSFLYLIVIRLNPQIALHATLYAR